MEALAGLIDWQNQDNFIFLNPRWPEEIRNFFDQGIQKWIQQTQSRAVIFLPTSGTTAPSLKDHKIVALDKKAILVSAQSVGKFFSFSSQDRVASILPCFHIGGLAQEARGFLWRQTLCPVPGQWQASVFYDFLVNETITHTSLVPTQLYDLVQTGRIAPKSLRCFFVGGGYLGTELRLRAQRLGWRPVVTYGMTETSSMVAVQKENYFQALPHVALDVNIQGFLRIRSAALFKGYLDFTEGHPQFSVCPTDGFTSEDRGRGEGNRFELLGRQQDYAKISGEGVYLSRLQGILQDCAVEQQLPSLNLVAIRFVPSDRRGHEVQLVGVLPPSELQSLTNLFNQKVLPFERIQEFHQVNEIPTTELGKIKWQGVQ